jgi:hypothetical protein
VARLALDDAPRSALGLAGLTQSQKLLGKIVPRFRIAGSLSRLFARHRQIIAALLGGIARVPIMMDRYRFSPDNAAALVNALGNVLMDCFTVMKAASIAKKTK